MSDLELAAVRMVFQLVPSVQHRQDLNSAYSVQHVRIMSRSCSEAATIVKTGESEVDDILAGQCVWVTEKVTGRKAPVDSIQAKVLAQPVFQFFSGIVEALDVLNMFLNAKLQLWR